MDYNTPQPPPGQSFSLLRFLFGIILTICLLLGIYLGIMAIWWYFDECSNKKTFWRFVADFNYQPCDQPKGVESETQAEINEAEREILQEKEVYQISDQNLTYKQAQHKCQAYGGRLATENEIRDAYNKGANWCSYGWSEGQNAFYPIQPNWFRKQSPERRRECGGRPGVIGGYFDNAHMKFGANCYGIKPEGRVVPLKKDHGGNKSSEKDFCDRPENKHACKADDRDVITSWNKRHWSEYD
jgi:hypothetical protein